MVIVLTGPRGTQCNLGLGACAEGAASHSLVNLEQDGCSESDVSPEAEDDIELWKLVIVLTLRIKP